MKNELLSIETISKENVLACMTEIGVDGLLSQIKAYVDEFTPDTSTAKGRKEIASMAFRVSKSKSLIDGFRKDSIAEKKRELKIVDASGKLFRDECDKIRDKVRLPLTEWEAAEVVRIERERLETVIQDCFDSAIAENIIFDKNKEMERKERDFAKKELEAKERRENEERENSHTLAIAENIIFDRTAEIVAKDYTEKLKIENDRLEKEAEKEREDQAKREKEAADKAVSEAKIKSDKLAAQAKIDADNAATQAVTDKENAVKAATKKAEDAALLAAKNAEDKRLKEKAEADRLERVRTENKAHQSKTMGEAKESLMLKVGIDEELARKIVLSVAKNEIANLKIIF